MAPGNITPQVVQTVRDAIDIVSIAEDYTRLTKRGKRFIGLCPFHKEKTPSFSVTPDEGLYYCFGCGAGGDAIKLYMEQSGDDFPAAIEALAQRFGIPLPTVSTQVQQGPDTRTALEAAATFFRTQLARNGDAQHYLAQRRLPTMLHEAYGLGYAPDGWRTLLEALPRQGIAVDNLEAAGLIGRSERNPDKLYDRFRHRLMFPIYSPAGRIVGFGGRTLGDDRAKYINTQETERFHKGRLLYGFHRAKRAMRESGRALLVEGYFDVIGAAACGIEWAVAGMGTALTPEQARLLSRYADEVIIGFDGDAAGEKAFTRSLPILLAEGLAVRRARFPQGHDPDSLRLEAGPQAVVKAVEGAEDAIWLAIERLLPPPGSAPTPQAKSKAAAEVIEVLHAIRDRMVRHGYARRAAHQLDVPEDLLFGRLGAKPQLYAPTVERTAQAPSMVQSLEEKALRLLLHPSSPLPASEQLPPAAIFFNVDCRNIYAAFCDLYRGGGVKPPTAREVLAKLESGSSAIDQAARLLLEDAESGASELPEALSSLLRRWQKQRQPELMRQIKQAQNSGDQARLAQLLEEKKHLSRSLHPGMTGNWW